MPMIFPKNPTTEECIAIISLYLQNQNLQGESLKDIAKLFYQAKDELRKIYKDEYPQQIPARSSAKKTDLSYNDEW